MTITESNVTILVKDMDKAVSFYEMLGLTLKNRWGNHYAQLAAKDIIIGLHPGGGAETSSHISIGFMIDNIEEAKALLDANHIAYKTEEGKAGTFMHFKDPDGTILYFNLPNWK